MRINTYCWTNLSHQHFEYHSGELLTLCALTLSGQAANDPARNLRVFRAIMASSYWQSVRRGRTVTEGAIMRKSPVSNPDDVWTFLELVAGHPHASEPGAAGELIGRAHFDHDRMVGLAMRHGLLPSVANFLHVNGLRRSLPTRLRNPVLNALYHSRHRSALLTLAAVEINAALSAHKIPVVWTKGVVLQTWLYRNTGTRLFNDLDIMVLPEHRESVSEVLMSAGFKAGHRFDPSSATLVPVDRKTTTLYRLSPDHLVPFNRLTGDVAVPVVVIDVANSLTWHGSPWDVPVHLVQEPAVLVPVREGDCLPAMAPPHSLLFLCLHLFREGWFEGTIRLKDISLAQFADISLAWRQLSGPERQELGRLIHHHGLQEPLAWATAHTDSIFGDMMTEELDLSEYATADWLSSARGRGEDVLHWSGTMRERLRANGHLVLQV
ncbi:nucleotidyltransferase family protein [Promicromonospora sp. NPDC057488]|uniref:nucleotidyltransferase family protein n=1 Tax=Promicromonospora sp. NPDC057488 TaxID=3346147 RepID=UPI0036721583